MILHVTFSDGSNPWVFYGTRQEVAKHWRRWMKYHPDTARPTAEIGKYFVYQYCDFYYVDNGTYSYGKYKHLGHALAALERLGGERP